jgi:hypothetical protein
MSNNFFRIINNILFIIQKKTPPKIDSSEFLKNLYGSLLIGGVHGLYSLSTEKNEEIKVENKYKMVNYGFTNFMVVDNKGRHFNVNNSFWYWKWDGIEEWENIDWGSKIVAKYYGWRVPFLGLFPNIVDTKKVNTIYKKD